MFMFQGCSPAVTLGEDSFVRVRFWAGKTTASPRGSWLSTPLGEASQHRNSMGGTELSGKGTLERKTQSPLGQTKACTHSLQ